jgi:D-3-phosphoglycerate dehydrogenase
MMSMLPKKVMVKESISRRGLDLLERDFEVVYCPEMSREEMLEAIADCHALIVRSATKVDAEVIAAGRLLEVIGRAGVGVDNIDVDAATKRGIMVINAPQSNIISAAEHTMALILSSCRNIPAAANSLREGRWDRKSFEGVELYHKTIGILGLGRIGILVAQRCQGFGMRVISYDPYISSERAQKMGVEMKESLEELLEEADFITVHLPKSTETHHIIGKSEFARMKEGVRVYNVARGGIISEEALIEALRSGKVAGAGLDVFEKEPLPPDSPLAAMDNVIATPHLGASTQEAQDRAGVMIAEQVAAALRGEFVSNVVNLEVPAEVDEEVKPFLPLCEKLGCLLTYLLEGHVDEIGVEYLGGLAEHEAGVLTVAVLKGFFGRIADEPVTYVNAPVFAKERGIAVRESRSSSTRDYVNLIMVRGKRGGSEIAVGGTLVGLSNTERFVHVYEYDIDLGPSRYMAFFRYDDVPGMIGKIGTILGEAGINIAHMQVGRKKIGGEAVMGINVDVPIPEEVMKKIMRAKGVTDGKFITLW